MYDTPLDIPVPASPLVLIIAAPSDILRSASPRLRAPQTKGILKGCLSTWFSPSAGVSTTQKIQKSHNTTTIIPYIIQMAISKNKLKRFLETQN